jgi:hypothetical protein
MVKSLVKSSLAIPKRRDNHMSSRETGKNSVIPSIIARTIACNVVIYTFFGFFLWRELGCWNEFFFKKFIAITLT